MEYFVISAKFVPLKYYTLSLQLRRLASFSVGCLGRRILSPGQIAVMRKWSILFICNASDVPMFIWKGLIVIARNWNLWLECPSLFLHTVWARLRQQVCFTFPAYLNKNKKKKKGGGRICEPLILVLVVDNISRSYMKQKNSNHHPVWRMMELCSDILVKERPDEGT